MSSPSLPIDAEGPGAIPIHPTGSTAELLQRAVEEAARLLEADGAMVYLLDDATGELTFAHDAGVSDVATRRWVRGLVLRSGEGMFGKAVAERRVLATGDYPADASFRHAPGPDRVVREVGIRSLVVAPLVAGNRVYGGLGTFARREAAFPERDIALIKALADHAAAAMANARLIEDLAASELELERRADAERSLREIAARIIAIREPGDLLQDVVDAAKRLVRGDGAILALLEDETGLLRWGFDTGVRERFDPAYVANLTLEVGVGVTGRAVAERRPLVVNEGLIDAFPRVPESDHFFEVSGFRSMIAAPIVGETGPLGALEVYSRKEGAFSQADSARVAALADQAAIALTNVRLIRELDRSRDELRRAAGAERALREIGGRITALHEPAEVLQRTVDEAARLLAADGARIDLIDEPTGALLWAYDAATGMRPGLGPIKGDGEAQAGEGISGRAVIEGRALYTGDYLVDERFQHAAAPDAHAREHEIRSVVAAPIAGEHGALGTLTVYTSKRDAFGADHARLIEALASQAAIAITNADLIEELARSREEIAKRADAERSLREVAARITAMHEPTEILARIVTDAARLVGADRGQIDLTGDVPGRLSYSYPQTVPADLAGLRDASTAVVNPRAGMAAKAIEAGRGVVTGDYLVDDSFPHFPEADDYVRQVGLRSVVAAPLLAESGLLGVLQVGTSRPAAFGADDVAIIEGLANQAAIALTNARLIEELATSRADVERSEQRYRLQADELARLVDSQRTLAEMTAQIAALRDPTAVIQRTVDEAVRLLGADAALLNPLDAETGVLMLALAVAPSGREIDDVLVPLGEGVSGRAVAEGRVIRTGDYANDPAFSHLPALDEYISRRAMASVMSAPLIAGDGPIGALSVQAERNDAFGEDDAVLLRLLADQAAIAIANTRLYERLEGSERRYRHLVDNSPDMIWSADAEGRFTLVSDSVERLFGYRADEVLGRPWGMFTANQSMDEAAERWASMAANPGQEHRVRFDVLHKDGRTVPVEIHMIATVADGRFAGAHGSLRDVSERERLEAGLRRQAAELASSAERAHLARELHDSVTQALFSMTLLTRSIELLLTRDLGAVPEKLAALRDLQRDALAEMRSLIFELRPGSLEEEGLVHALRTHTAAVQGRIGLPVVFEATLEDRLPVEVEDVLFRIAQEALHNIVKHASARQVRVAVSRTDGTVRLQVTDDGKGFDPATVPDGHLGLAGMRARADKIGAAFEVRSRPGAGTSISIAVPLQSGGERSIASAE